MKSKILDLVGISAATLCLIHCIVFPLLMIAPLGLSHHPMIDLFFFIIGVLVVFSITKKMTSKPLKFLFWISLALIGTSVFLDLLFHLHTHLIFVGAAGLIISHFINFKNYHSGADHF